MTDQPGPRPEERLPVRATPSEPVPAERFTAPPSAHSVGLTPERAAQVVRQSGSARWFGFIAVTLIAVFVVVYYFYEVGLPWGTGPSRLENEVAVQQVTDVTRGYKLFQANCSRCHGAQGEGGIGPKLNDQAKLLTHLSEAYLTNVLTVGGRFVCGDPNSLMLAWKEPAGPLNYREIQELIAFLRAPSTTEFEVSVPDPNDPTKTVTTTVKGWRDPSYQPPAGATPVPDCWKDAFTGGATPAPSGAPGSPAPSGAPGSPAPSGAPGSPAPSGAPGSPAPSGAPGSPAPSGAPGSPAPSGPPAGVVLKISAQGTAFDTDTLEAPAGTPFLIEFANNDAGIPHNVAIRDASGAMVFSGDIFSGVETRTYQVPALAAGTYTFFCTVHTNMTGTLTVK